MYRFLYEFCVWYYGIYRRDRQIYIRTENNMGCVWWGFSSFTCLKSWFGPWWEKRRGSLFGTSNINSLYINGLHFRKWTSNLAEVRRESHKRKRTDFPRDLLSSRINGWIWWKGTWSICLYVYVYKHTSMPCVATFVYFSVYDIPTTILC